jgi:tetratricopeptide (TPR) repeat protein
LEWDLATDSIDPLPRVYSGDKAIARRLYDTAVTNMESVIARYPNDVRARLAYMDILRSGGMVLFELPVEKTVEENLKIAETLSPARQQVVYSKITFLAGTGHMDEALALTRTQIDRDPSIADGYYTLARLYAIQKNYYKIVDVLDRAMLAGVRFTDPVEQGFTAEGYEREGRFRDALYWYDQMYKSTGNDRVAYKRDELARQTQLAVPQHIEDFFPFSQYVSSTPSL